MPPEEDATQLTISAKVQRFSEIPAYKIPWIQAGEFPAPGPARPPGLDHCLPPEVAIASYHLHQASSPLPLEANAYLEYLTLGLIQAPPPGNLNFQTATQRVKHIWTGLVK